MRHQPGALLGDPEEDPAADRQIPTGTPANDCWDAIAALADALDDLFHPRRVALSGGDLCRLCNARPAHLERRWRWG